MRKLLLTVVMLLVANSGWTGSIEMSKIKGYIDGCKNNDCSSGILTGCAVDISRLSYQVPVKLYAINEQKDVYFCYGVGNRTDAACNARFGVTGTHGFECQVTSGYYDGLIHKVESLAFWMPSASSEGTHIPGPTGVMQYEAQSPGAPPALVCAPKTCQVCNNGQTTCQP